MRRLLLLPACALLLLAAPVLALEPSEPPPTTTTTIPLTSSTPVPDPTTGSETASTPEGVDSTDATVADGPVDDGWSSDVTPVDATIVGVTWDGDIDASFTIDVRSSDGEWTAARGIEASDHPDVGTKDATRAASFPDHGTEPLWVGEDATAVRVTLEQGEASDVAVAAIDAAPAPAPGGSAGAITGVLGSVDGAGRWIFGAALLVTVAALVALALGWRPAARLRTRSGALRVAGLVAVAVAFAACVPVQPPPPPPAGNGAYPAQPPIQTRASWGARPFACAGGPEYAPSLRFAVVHHTVNSNSYGPGDSASIMRGIQSYHLDALGYCDIAYQFLIDRFGTIWEGRAGGITNPVIGGHAGGFNTGSVGVALIGDFTSVQPPAAAWNSLVSFLQWRLSVAHINPAAGVVLTAGSSPCGCVKFSPGQQVSFPNAIVNHRDLDYTACPGNAFAPRLVELQNAVQPGIRFPQ